MGRNSGPEPSAAFRSVLAVIGHGEDYGVLERSCALARDHAAMLTVMRVWSPTRLIYWAGLAGAHPADLIAHHESEAARSLREVAAEIPSDTPCTLICRRGRLAKCVTSEVLAGRHDCVVVGRGALTRRGGARLRRLEPALGIVLAGDRTPFAGAPRVRVGR